MDTDPPRHVSRLFTTAASVAAHGGRVWHGWWHWLGGHRHRVEPRCGDVFPSATISMRSEAAVWGEDDGWRAVELALLREAGDAGDQLETLRGQPAERTAQRTLLSVLAALGLER